MPGVDVEPVGVVAPVEVEGVVVVCGVVVGQGLPDASTYTVGVVDEDVDGISGVIAVAVVEVAAVAPPVAAAVVGVISGAALEAEGVVAPVAESTDDVVGVVGVVDEAVVHPVMVAAAAVVGVVSSVLTPVLDVRALWCGFGLFVRTASTVPPRINASTTRNGIHGNPRRAGTSMGAADCWIRRFGLSGLSRIADPHSRQNSCPRSTGARHSGQDPPIPTPIDEVSERRGVLTRIRHPGVDVRIPVVREPFGFLPEPSRAPSASPGDVFHG